MPNIFIDGQAGTTGLAIRQRLAQHGQVNLLTPTRHLRKDLQHRLDLMQEADVTILCLPDESAKEIVAAAPRDACILDASTAFRVADGWTYGLPEMTSTQRNAIRNATRISNPGCYPTAVILMLRPLIAADLLPQTLPVTVIAQSGYSGGGKALIEAYEQKGHKEQYASARPYSLTSRHKHLPEMELYSGTGSKIVFLPSVNACRQGMLVQIPIHLDALESRLGAQNIFECWRQYYSDEPLINIVEHADALPDNGYLNPAGLAESDCVELTLFTHNKQLLLTARLDNLGKGAGGAAVQNLNLLLRLPELTGLQNVDS